MKGVILAAGHGEELKPLTDNISKPMIPILDKPMIQYAIERFSSNGITDLIIVTKENNTEIQDYFNDGEALSVRITYVSQKSEGIDGAILSVSDYFKETEQFILTHCDIIASSNLLTRTLNAADNLGSDMALAVTLQSELQDFGVVTINTDGFVEEVISEDGGTAGNYVVAGTFLLTGKIFAYLKQGIAFNECFNSYIKEGGLVATGVWNETWIDIGRPWDILRATSYLLSALSYSRISTKVTIEHNVEIKGPVIIEEGAKILNGTVIQGPVYVGKNAFIGNNSLIRDCSVIDDWAKIGMGVEVKNSVIMKGASIARLSYVGSSIIGPKATLHSGAITIITKKPFGPITTTIQGKEVVVPLDKFGAIVGSNSHVGEHSSLFPGTIIDSNAIVPPNTAVGGQIKANE
ncbi:MAG: NTP transferase domain-containing protein [Candidatus Heimdallarchaeota archaeon]|nr:NTP transferase domain-containing protein [Candidatus Heimdallarchaeota archaeon]